MNKSSIKLIHILILIVISTIAFYGQTVETQKTAPKVVNKTESQEKTEQQVEKKVEDERISEADSEYDPNQKPNRRIVTPEQVKKTESVAGNIFIAPFRALAPKVNSGLTRLETEGGLDKLTVYISNPYIRPTFGSVSEGSGFGLGVNLSTAEKLSENYNFYLNTHATFSKYVEVRGGVEIAPKKFANGKLNLNLSGRYLLMPREDFYGSGVNSFRSNHTSYYRREQGARFEASWQTAKRLKIGAFSDFSYNSITDGTDETVAVITQKFNSTNTPGLARNIRLLDNGAFAEFDGRDLPDNPQQGGFAKFTVSSTNGLGRLNNYDSINYNIDARGYLPIGTKNRVLAVRFLGDFKDVKASANVPLFRLARLGDSETLRGYESYRFQGINSVHLNIEYRFRLAEGSETGGFRGVNGVLFTDLGQVFNNRQELSFQNIKATWGGGLQFLSQKGVVLNLLYAKSPERSRLIFRFGKTF